MVNVPRVREVLAAVAARPDWHFAIGIRIRFANPTLLYQTYPQDWVSRYNAEALVFTDPTVRWGLEHQGVCRWSDLAADDEAGVMEKAASHGLRYGIVVSVGDAAARTLGFFCREDRELAEEECSFAAEQVQALHDATAGVAVAGDAELGELRTLAAAFRR